MIEKYGWENKMSSSDYLLNTSLEYSIYVADTRGIANVVDGLKTSQRIALWLLRNKSEKIKTLGLVGLMAAERLYVHGDASAANAINLLAAPFKNNIPLIQGEGEFGSRISPDGIGAPRYTEVRRSKFSESVLYCDLPNVPLIKNYDGSNMMPKYFLPIIPTVLLNGINGVAVGFSTKILPRNPKELVQATIDVLNKKTPKKLIPYYHGYNSDVKEIGENQYENTGKAHILNSSTIRVTELPPGLSLDDFRARLIKMEDNDEIVDFEDNSSETILVDIKLKRGMLLAQPARTETLPDGKKVKIPAKKAWTEQDAISFLKLKEKVTERIVVIDWDQTSIKQYNNPIELIEDFVKFRLTIYKDRYERLLSEANIELMYWYLLKALFENGFTKKLGTFLNKADMILEINRISTKAKLTPSVEQVEKATSLPTYRWTKEFKDEIDNNIKKNLDLISEYSAILSSKTKMTEIYSSELEDAKKVIKL